MGCCKIGTSSKAKRLVKCPELVPADGKPIAIVIGAMAHGEVIMPKNLSLQDIMKGLFLGKC